MKRNKYFILAFMFFYSSLLSAGSSTTVVSPRIAWDYSSMKRLAPKGGYPRLLRLADGSFVAVYEDHNGNTDLIRTYDGGNTWSSPFQSFGRFNYVDKGNGNEVLVNAANPEIVQLKNGTILLACNYRPEKDGIIPFSIAVRRSEDNGKTWTDPQMIYKGGKKFQDGCWEPSFLQLPDGEVKIYFSNETKFTDSDDQDIEIMTSKDNGKTWSEPRTVSYRAGHRDGMPVARIIKDEIVASIEDNHIDQFKPYTVRTKIADDWSVPVLADSPGRNYALSEKVADDIYMGAPYLLALPRGENLLSYQTTRGRDNHNWELSTMEVAIGDTDARNFTRVTRPFEISLSQQAKWNSLAMWDENTVVALSSVDLKNSTVAPWMIKGHIIYDLNVKGRLINDYPVFVGSRSEANVSAGMGRDVSNLYIKCKVKDSTPILAGNKASSCDGVYFYLDAGNFSLAAPDKGLYKIWCSRKGEMVLWEGKGGAWVKSDRKIIKLVVRNRDDGYTISCTISVKGLYGFNGQSARFSVGLTNCTDREHIVNEILANSDATHSDTWLKVNFNHQ